MTKKELAEAVQVDERTIRRYESASVAPPKDVIVRLAAKLAFPEEFFLGHELDEPPEDAVSFRSMSAMPARDRDAALAAGCFAFMLSDWVEQRFDLAEPNLPDLGVESPEGAARSLREMWGLGERPIRDMINVLEGNGVRVFSLAEYTRTIDAFSVWRMNKPYVFLNSIKTPEHSRFDAAHELGHLVLHKHGGPRGRIAEEHANAFARLFLMPSADVFAVIPEVYSIERLLEKKVRWRVSATALNYHLHKLGITSEWVYRTFCIQLAERGYRKSEPDGIEKEISAVWQMVFGDLRQQRVTKHHIADTLRLPVEEIEKLVFGLATMISLDGGGGEHGPGDRGRANLRLVSG